MIPEGLFFRYRKGPYAEMEDVFLRPGHRHPEAVGFPGLALVHVAYSPFFIHGPIAETALVLFRVSPVDAPDLLVHA